MSNSRWMTILMLLCLSACSRTPDTDSPHTCEDLVKAAVESPVCREAQEKLQEQLRQERHPEPYTGGAGKLPQYRW